MEVSDLLAKARALPLPQRRRVAAIMGSLVADAAGKRTNTSSRKTLIPRVLRLLLAMVATVVRIRV